MSRYDIYQSNAAEVPLMRKWIIRAFFLSLLLHGGLFAFFQMKKLENFGPPAEERLAKPLRVFKQVKIPDMPKDQEETRLKLPDKVPNVAQLTVPDDKPQVEDIHLAPQAPEMPKPLISDKPKADATGSDLFAKVEAQSRGAMDKELNSLSGSLLKDSPRSPRQPAITLPKSNRKPGDLGAGGAEGIPGTISIDRALEMGGPLPSGNKPIGMPGGALYEYNSADLKPEAIEQLQKLGELIKRNPKATFSIEGHTDSLGDPVYNLSLSERRAGAVRDWLVAVMRIGNERIQIKGFGSSKPIVIPNSVDENVPGALDAEIARQQPNRRVEIVIKTNRR
jgi:outer membrane protein OmpA-like peptidoglycan-associated protein